MQILKKEANFYRRGQSKDCLKEELMCDKRGNNPKNDECHYWNDYKVQATYNLSWMSFMVGEQDRWKNGGKKTCALMEKKEDVCFDQFRESLSFHLNISVDQQMCGHVHTRIKLYGIIPIYL